jgi:hypothetical protein
VPKKFNKSLPGANFFSKIGPYGYLKNPEFEANFRYKGIIQKKIYQKKDNPKKLFFL